MTLKVGFAGAGGIASVHLKNMRENKHVNIAAISDIVKEQAERVAAEYGAAAYTDVNEMLESEKLDILFICVPPFAHGDIEERAAAKGIHLFVEKPLGLDMDTVRAKAKHIRESGVLAASGYCLRYLNTAAFARQYLQDKEIGMVRAHYLTSFVGTPWWRVMEKSGGQLVEQATHTVDMVRFLAGEINEVYARMALTVMQDIEGLNIPDVGTVSVQFESGAVGHIDTTCIQPDHRTLVEVMGRDFRVSLDGTSLTIIDKKGTLTLSSSGNFYKDQDDAFVEAVRTGNRELILSPYEDAMKTLEVTLAANQSAAEGVPVKLQG
jgi:predicted dehydrogenase